MCLIILYRPSFLLEIRVIIKISKNPCYPINVDWFSLGWSKKKFKMAKAKKPHFPAPPILNIFSWKFHGLVLGLVELIDAKGIGMAQLISLWGCLTYAQKQTKNAFLVFLGCFWAYAGQPHNHIGWATSMPFASINPTNPRTNPWNFHKKILRIGGAGKWPFFRRPFWIFFQKEFFFASSY